MKIGSTLARPWLARASEKEQFLAPTRLYSGSRGVRPGPTRQAYASATY